MKSSFPVTGPCGFGNDKGKIGCSELVVNKDKTTSCGLLLKGKIKPSDISKLMGWDFVEKIKEGIAFHYSNGQKCILDWERAWLAGAVKKEDVPDGRQWWTAKEKSKEELTAEAVSLGIEVDARWSANTLAQKIKEHSTQVAG